MKSTLSIRYYVAVLLLAAACAVGVLSWKAYVRESRVDLSAVTPKEGKDPKLVLAEVEALFNQSKTAPARFEVIAEKNVFTPERKAWAPPPPPKPEELAKVRVNRNDVVLYGTYLADKERRAIILFRPLKSPTDPGTRIVAEGQTVRDVTGKIPAEFTVQKINPQNAMIRDKSGQTFQIGLFENKHSQGLPKAAAATSPGAPTIAVDRPAEAKQDGAKQNEGKPETPTATTVPAPGAAPRETQSAPTEGLSIKQLDSMPEEQKEDLVKQGKVKKIVTPFGPVYRPIEKQ